MVDPVSAGTGFAISILAASSYDFLKSVYVQRQVEKTIKSTADEIAESHNLIIDGDNPLRIALESDETGELVDGFKQEGVDISVEQLSGVLENTLEAEFDTTPQEQEINPQDVMTDYLKMYEGKIVTYDEIRYRIFLHYFRELSHNQTELLEEYATDLEEQARKIEKHTDRLGDNVDRMDDRLDRLTSLTDEIEEIVDQAGIDKTQLAELREDLQELKADRLSRDELEQIVDSQEIEQDIASTLTEILLLILKRDLAKAEAKMSRLKPLMQGVIALDSTYEESRTSIDINSEYKDDRLLIRIQNHQPTSIYVHMEIDGRETMLIDGERTKRVKNISVRPREQQNLAYPVEPVIGDALTDQQPKFNSWYSLRALDDTEVFPKNN